MTYKEYRENFLKAGSIASQVRSFGQSLLKEGASYRAVIAKIYQKIYELGAIPAFPPQIAMNHVAAHFFPSPAEDFHFVDQLLKLDIGVCYQGAIGDCAVSVDLSGKHQKLIDAAQAALEAAQGSLKVGLSIGTIGKTIADTIHSFGLKPVANLAGHGLGLYQVHTPPTIPNRKEPSHEKIRPGMTFAIEPFVTNGNGWVETKGAPTLFSLISTKTDRLPLSGKKIVEICRSFQGLPFSLDDLERELPDLPSLHSQVRSLIVCNILAAYPPLVEKVGSFVAQAENSILVDQDGSIHISTL